jgi:hypothetical protein
MGGPIRAMRLSWRAAATLHGLVFLEIIGAKEGAEQRLHILTTSLDCTCFLTSRINEHQVGTDK